MPLINSFIQQINKNRLRQIDSFATQPLEIQEKQLFDLVGSAKNTEYGKKYGFSSIKNIEEFQKRLPIWRYEEFSPYIERIRKGEQNILWPGKIKWFAKSSGTTNDKSKFIPISCESLHGCHFRGGRDVLAVYMRNFPDTHIYTGKTLTLGGSVQINQFFNQTYYGDLSAIMLRNIPFLFDLIRVPNSKVAIIPKWEEKLDKLTRETIDKNVIALAGVPSWNLVMIKHILEFTGKENLLEVWPGLELFIHGGVSFIPYREQFKRLIPSEKMNYLETYNASEGFFALQDDPSTNDMLLMLDYGIFYEFILLKNLIHQIQERIILEKLRKTGTMLWLSPQTEACGAML